MVSTAVPEPGPTGRNPGGLAAELRELATDPRVAVHRVALEELAEGILTPGDLARWAGTDLVAAYAAGDSFLPAAPGAKARAGRSAALSPGRPGGLRGRFARAARVLAGSTGALVFVPLLVTWAGLGAAAWAYQRMRAEGKGEGQTFLALWQEGFAGHLAVPLHFDMLVGYTVTALSLLVLATILRHRHERAEEASARVLAARLAGALVQVQGLAVEAAHATPQRFGEELRGAAQNLRSLGKLADRAQRETNGLIAEARATSSLTQAAAEALGQGMRELQSAAESVARSTDSVSQAAAEAHRGAQVLSGEVGKVLDGMGQGVRQAAGNAAERLAEAAAEAVRRISQAAEAAAEREETAASRSAELLDRTARTMDGTFGSARASLESAAGELASAVQRLDGSVAGLPAALEVSAADGAERIGWAYDQAVVALAATLREDVRAASAELVSHVAQLRELGRLREEAAQAADRGRAHTEDELRHATEEFRVTLGQVADLVHDAADRLTRSLPAPVGAAGAALPVFANGFDRTERRPVSTDAPHRAAGEDGEDHGDHEDRRKQGSHGGHEDRADHGESEESGEHRETARPVPSPDTGSASGAAGGGEPEDAPVAVAVAGDSGPAVGPADSPGEVVEAPGETVPEGARSGSDVPGRAER